MMQGISVFFSVAIGCVDKKSEITFWWYLQVYVYRNFAK